MSMVLSTQPNRKFLTYYYYDAPVSDETPIFHSASRKVWYGYHVLLGQWELFVEIILVVLQDQRSCVLSEFGLTDGIFSGHYSEFHLVLWILRFHVSEIRNHVRHQISGHRYGLFKLVDNVVRIRRPGTRDANETFSRVETFRSAQQAATELTLVWTSTIACY